MAKSKKVWVHPEDLKDHYIKVSDYQELSSLRPFRLISESHYREMKKELKELMEINVILGQDLLSHMGTLKQKKGTK